MKVAKNMTKRLWIPAFPLCLFILCLIFQPQCANGVRRGIKLALDCALPALFPFLFLSSLMVKTSRDSVIPAKVLPLILGLCCGFPIGIRTAAELKKDGVIDGQTAKRLAFSCNNTGPAFVLGVCGERVLHSRKFGLLLFFLEMLAALFLYLWGGLLFPKKAKTSQRKTPLPPRQNSFSALCSEACRAALSSCGNILSYMLLFSFFLEVVFSVLPFKSPLFSAVFSLFFEITAGMESLKALPPALALPLAGMGLGWTGVSVHLQSRESRKICGLSAKSYLLGKGASALFLFAGTAFFGKLL